MSVTKIKVSTGKNALNFAELFLRTKKLNYNDFDGLINYCHGRSVLVRRYRV